MTASDRDLSEEVERLRAENATLRTGVRRPHLRVSERGAVSLYGLRRFPITFYVEEWERILGLEAEIRAFLRDHAGELKRKPARDAPPPASPDAAPGG